MKSRRSPIELLGPALGVLVLALTVFALVYLLWIQPFYRAASYPHGRWGGRGVVGSLSGAGWESREATERVEGPIEILAVRNVSGPIRVSGWDQDHVQVTYVKQARTVAALDEFQIEISPRGRQLSVRPLYRSARAVAATALGPVAFDIRVPSTVRRIEARNVSGSIELENLNPGVAQDLQSVSGGIRTERSADLRAESVSGSIGFVFAGANLELQTTSGRIDGEILSLQPGGRVEAESISGSVTLKAFDALSAQLDLSSASGSIGCDFPIQVQEQKRTRLQGRIAEGAVPFRVHTLSGSIRLTR